MHKEALYLYGFCKGAKLPLTLKAITYTTKLYEGEKRDNGDDYIKHPLEVCRRLINNRVRDDEVLAAAILHDTIEDEKVSTEDIEKTFNKGVGYLVDLLTKKKCESIEEYYKKISTDIRSITIKAVDRVCNVSDMVEIFSTKRLDKYVKETEEYILPMMKRARRVYLGYSDTMVSIRDNINGVLKPVKEVIRLEEKISDNPTTFSPNITTAKNKRVEKLFKKEKEKNDDSLKDWTPLVNVVQKI